MTSTEALENPFISDAAWESFWKAQRADVDAYFALARDPHSYDIVESFGDDKSPLLELYNLKSGDGEPSLDDLEKLPPLNPKNVGTKDIQPNGKAIKESTEKCNASLTSDVNYLKDLVDKGKEKPTSTEWSKKMDELKKETLDKVDKNITEAFDKLKKMGDDHPEERPILEKVGKSFKTFCVTLSDFIKKVSDWIFKILDTIWDALKKVGRWASDKIPKAVQIAIKFFFL
jgi:hypothetical protein